MPIDPFTVLLLGLFIKILLGGMFGVFWLNDRRSFWFGWWSLAFLAGAVANILFLTRGLAPDLVSMGIGSAALTVVLACCWQGARSFERRQPLLLAVVLPPAIWLGACLTPGFMESVHARIILSSIMVSALAGLTSFEFWRGRDEALPSRWPIIVLFGTLALFFALRIPLVELLPFPYGARTMTAVWVAGFNLFLFVHSILLAVLVVAISKERLEFDQRVKAQTDSLTGALNRRAFSARADRLLARHRHDRKPLSVLFLDLDHFKALNDRFGHGFGDVVLIKFVAVVQDAIRPTDFLFRIGGEEFCCILPSTQVWQAEVVAERIRVATENAALQCHHEPVKITVSIGIASADTAGYDLDGLIGSADAAVYAAKEQGRNRCVTAVGHQTPEARPLRLAVNGR